MATATALSIANLKKQVGSLRGDLDNCRAVHVRMRLLHKTEDAVLLEELPYKDVRTQHTEFGTSVDVRARLLTLDWPIAGLVNASQQPDKSIRNAYTSRDSNSLALAHACGVGLRRGEYPSIASEHLTSADNAAFVVAGLYVAKAVE